MFVVALTKNSHMISHMKPEFHIWNEKFHIWNWIFTCEIKISHMNYRISYMTPNNSYVKTYMWNRITYEFLDSYMKFLYVKTNHIWNLYVKTYHIWNPQFIYEILYVKTNHIWNLYVKTNHIWNWNSICKNKSHIKSPIHVWSNINTWTNRIWNPKFIHVYVLYHRNTQFILDWISLITYMNFRTGNIRTCLHVIIEYLTRLRKK